jgi:predicted AAA+ superfamily ATPase
VRIFRVQFDDVPSLGAFNEPIIALVRWFEANVLKDSINGAASRGEPVYLLFDEVQNLKGWATQLKSFVDHVTTKTLVTGSSALRIGDGNDSLAGRISMIELGPLRLQEIAGVRDIGQFDSYSAGRAVENWTRREFWLDLLTHVRKHKRIVDRAFRAYSDVGGYPVCHKVGGRRDELADLIVSTVVERTLVHDLKAGRSGSGRDRGVIEETFRRVCRYAGRAVAPKRIREEVAQVLGAGVREQHVADAIEFLGNAMLVHQIPPLEALTKKQVHPPKICLCDPFVREGWLQEKVPFFPADLASANQAVSTVAGGLIESIIGYYLHGIPGVETSWFPERSSEPEVDFVLTIGTRRIPVEVKYCRGQPKPSDLAGLRSFCSAKKYGADFGLLITQELSGPVDDVVIGVPASAFLCVR